MYTRIGNKSYRDSPFTDAQFTCCPNYVYSSVVELLRHEVPKSSLVELAWCRTVGILQSYHGQLYVCDMSCSGGVASDIKIQVSVVYLKSPQSTFMIESIVMPCPVQIYGSISWHSRAPVIYVKLLQVLSVSRALQMKDIMDQLIVFKSDGPMRITR